MNEFWMYLIFPIGLLASGWVFLRILEIGACGSVRRTQTRSCRQREEEAGV